MMHDEEITLNDIDYKDFQLLIIAPTNPVAMNRWATEARELNIPYLYDPGMQIPRISSDELITGIMGSKILVLNDYEYEMMTNKTGLDIEEIKKYVELIVITLGEEGSRLIRGNEEAVAGIAKPEMVIDPTGAGDAYRAGLLKGYFEGADLKTIGEYASTTAVYAVEKQGGMEHRYTIDDFNRRYKQNFK
jgi:adenosine kinase